MSGTMKICFVGLSNLPALTPQFADRAIGGAQLQQVLLARQLVRRGHQVSMIVEDLGQPDDASWDGIATHKAYGPDEGLPVLRFIHPRWTKLVVAMRRANADVYYTSCAGQHVAVVAVVAALMGRASVFRVASDSDCDPSALLIKYWRDRKLYGYGLRKVDCILAQSSQQREALKRNYGITSVVAPSMVDLPEQVPLDCSKDIDVLWVSNVQRLKRPLLFLSVMRRLPGKKAVMVGGRFTGQERLYEEVQSRSVESGVDFVGPVDIWSIGSYFDRSRIVANTSEIEGFPNTFLQAWGRGIPVVSFLDPDGMIQGNQLGFRVDTEEAMASAIAQLLESEGLRAEIGLRGRNFVLERFGSATSVPVYERAFTTAIQSSRMRLQRS